MDELYDDGRPIGFWAHRKFHTVTLNDKVCLNCEHFDRKFPKSGFCLLTIKRVYSWTTRSYRNKYIHMSGVYLCEDFSRNSRSKFFTESGKEGTEEET